MAHYCLKKFKKNYVSNKFDINGSDERQFSSTGVRLNTITISKDQYYNYKEYQSSENNLNFVKSENIYKTLKIYEELINKIEKKDIYQNNIRFGEPMLSKYNLYPKLGGTIIPNKKYTRLDIILWILHLLDGTRSNEFVANYLGVKTQTINEISNELEKKGILKKINKWKKKF